MAVAEKLRRYLRDHEVRYKLIRHPHAYSSMETAEEAHVPGDALAKAVVVEGAEEYLLAVLPSDCHVDLERLRRMLGLEVEMATEEALDKLFPDCAQGAVPPLGFAYGLKTLWDASTALGSVEQVFFEAGDHQHLIKLSGRTFHELMSRAERGGFSEHL